MYEYVQQQLLLPSSSLLYSRKEKTWATVRETENSSIWNHIFKKFRDEVRPEGGHEKCCRLGTLTGVHQGAYTVYALLFFRLHGNVRS